MASPFSFQSFGAGTVRFRSSKHYDYVCAMLKVRPTLQSEMESSNTRLVNPEKCEPWAHSLAERSKFIENPCDSTRIFLSRREIEVPSHVRRL